jgi:hypothetical protein
MDPKEINFEDVNWMHLAQDRVQWWAHIYTVIIFRYEKRSGGGRL